MSLPELQQNPLVQRVIDIFDTDGNGEVDFKGGCGCCCCCSGLWPLQVPRTHFSLCCVEFIEGVSQFSVKGDKEQKLRCE